MESLTLSKAQGGKVSQKNNLSPHFFKDIIPCMCFDIDTIFTAIVYSPSA